jgi:Cu-Zn family superoxide dismutase
MRPTKDNAVAGDVTFTQAAEGLRVSVRLTGLTPGTHGFHVHEFGDCSAPDGASAGGHFNPRGSLHGGPDAAARHAGDFGNVVADAQGSVTFEYTDKQAALAGESSILGRGVIVHAKADDLTTQPTGNAGGRLACGVIGATK